MLSIAHQVCVNDTCLSLHVLQQMKLENYWQGEQAKCL